MKNCHLLILISMILLSSCGFGQRKNKQKPEPLSVKMSIYEFENKYDEVHIGTEITLSDCNNKKHERLKIISKLVSAENPGVILFQKEESSYFLCSKNNLLPIKIPKTVFYEAKSDCILQLELSDYDENVWNMDSEPFSPQKIKQEIDPDTTHPFTEFENPNVSFSEKNFSISFDLYHNIPNAEISANLYYKGKKCTTEVFSEAPIGKHRRHLYFYLNDLEIPPGEQTVSYEVFIKDFGGKGKSLFSGTTQIVQPQLYWFSFENTNADIDAENLDRTLNDDPKRLREVIAKKAKGDIFYQIQNDHREIFKSSVTKNSGLIPNQKGKVQIFIDKPLKIIFWDKDFLGQKNIGMFDIYLKQDGKQQIKLKDHKRIRNFDFSYTITAVNADNYSR